MIKEAYVSFETAKLLKEKGFDSDCFVAYNANGNIESAMELYGEETITNGECSEGDITAPTQQMAMAWLREKRIIITMDYDEYEISDNKKVGYGWNIQKIEKPTEYFKISIHVFDNYEETVEDALKYCLTNLI